MRHGSYCRPRAPEIRHGSECVGGVKIGMVAAYMPRRRTLFAATAWGLTAQALQIAIAFALLYFIAPWISPQEFGIAGLVAIVVGIAGAAADGGLHILCIQQRHIDQARAAREAALIGWGLALALWLLAPWIAAGLALEPSLLRAGVLTLGILGLAATARARLARTLSFARLAGIDVAVAAAVFGATIYAARAGLGAWALVLSDLFGACCGAALLWLLAPRAQPGGETPRRRDGWRIVGARFADTGFREADRLAVGTFLGPLALGLYRFGLRHSLTLVDRCNAVVDQVALPVLSEAKNDPQQTAQLYLRITRGYAVTLVLAGGALCWLGPVLLRVLYPPPWQSVGPLLVPFGIAVMAAGFNSQPGALWLAHGDARKKMRWSLGNLASLLVIVPAARYGGLITVIYTLAARSLVASVIAHRLSRTYGVTMRALARAVAPAAVLAACVLASLVF